jgi:hypothetical protein
LADLFDGVAVEVIRADIAGVVAAIDRHTAAAKQDGAARTKLARLLREIAEKHPSLRD